MEATFSLFRIQITALISCFRPYEDSAKDVVSNIFFVSSVEGRVISSICKMK